MNEGQPVYGLIAEFSSPADLLHAARSAHGAGYRRVEAYSPMPVEGLAEALGSHGNRISLLALAGGILGGVLTFALQWYSVTVDYPLNIGGRTPAWPGLVPSTFEMTVLGAALAAFFGTLLGNGLPRLYHPVFNEPGFSAASSDRFFLCIEAADPRFDTQHTRRFLEQLQPLKVSDVGA
ncbi:Transmembrane protein [Burkholderiales bacterium]|jgi:hypothetical protein|nr:Transmembrane protein [Burkholderiales bacterium]